ncbi:MAG: alpha/beta hydrolase [Bacteroidota bacterium]
MYKFLVSLILFSFFNAVGITQELSRRANFEAKIAWPDNVRPGAEIVELSQHTPLAKAGLKTNDIILAVNGRSVLTQEAWSAILYAIRADQPTQIIAKRGQERIQVSVQLKPYALEKYEGVEIFYESITNNYGQLQRTITSKPRGNEKRPAILLLQGLSCSSVEQYSGRSNNWVKLIQDLVTKSNMIVMRVEKPGVGDSEGDCGKVDFKTELSGYEAAIQALKNKPYVDTSKIIVYGNSMGSALAPYVANKYNLAGVISDGTFFKSWYEHMLEIERRILEIEGKDQATIYELMNEVYIPLYHQMLIEKKSFAEILTQNPLYRKHHRQGLLHMYGRSMEYYHQIQDFNFAKAWQEIQVPVRIRWGTNDWIMSEFDNDMIIEVLEKKGHQDHVLYKYPKLDHWSTIHPDYSASFYGKQGKWEDQISQQIIDWAWGIVKK